MNAINFKIQQEIPENLGRAGVLSTPHGDIETPAFATVGTLGTVKSVSPEELKDIGAQVVLANTYHLYLQPGADIVAQAGGLAKFMNWHGPTMTDSGGFQVFSLGFAFKRGVSKIAKMAPSEDELESFEHASAHSKLAQIDDDGVTFTSHLDGTTHRFTPEVSIAIQEKIGADMIFAFDECTSPLAPRKYMEQALERTHRWAKRCIDARTRKDQAMFGIVQGGRYEDLREFSAKEISAFPFDGFGIGGSFDKEDMKTIVELTNKILPKEKPRHMLGIGEVEDLFEGIQRGIDLFDCVLPTRLARHGILFTKDGKYDFKKISEKTKFEPVVADCQCYTCSNYTKAYLHHLIRSGELLGFRLASIHNLYFIVNLVKDIRQSILSDSFFDFKKEFLERYTQL